MMTTDTGGWDDDWSATPCTTPMPQATRPDSFPRCDLGYYEDYGDEDAM